MFRRDFILSWLAIPAVRWFRADGPSLDAAGNAADSDLPAFEWAKNLRPDDRALLRRAVTEALDDPRLPNLIERARPALDALRTANAIDSCRWEPEIPGLEDLGQGRLDLANIDIVRAACLSARELAGRGRGDAALDELFAAMTLAHRIGTGGVFISRVMECGAEVLVFRTVGRLMPILSRPTRDELSRRLDALPPPEPAAATIRQEYRFIFGSLHAKFAAIGPAIGDDQWAGLSLTPAQVEALKKTTRGERDRLLVHLETTGSAFDELARRIDLPRPGCRAALADFARDEEFNHPIAANLVEQAWGIRHVVDRLQAHRAMIHAALVLVRDGEPACRALRDPYGPGGFDLDRRDHGWILRSALRDDDRPEVSLEVGAAS